MAELVHVVDGQIVRIIIMADTTSSNLARLYPFGEVYVRFIEPHGLQWRVLQRGTRESDKMSYFDALLPIRVDQLPEIVQVVHTCTN